VTVSIGFESLVLSRLCQAHSPTTTDEANLLPALPFCQRRTGSRKFRVQSSEFSVLVRIFWFGNLALELETTTETKNGKTINSEPWTLNPELSAPLHIRFNPISFPDSNASAFP
jgi:hypothetical protein